jgi:hypothetical protein
MYTGALPAVSNRETRSLSITVTDDSVAAVDLTGATIMRGSRTDHAEHAARGRHKVGTRRISKMIKTAPHHHSLGH